MGAVQLFEMFLGDPSDDAAASGKGGKVLGCGRVEKLHPSREARRKLSEGGGLIGC